MHQRVIAQSIKPVSHLHIKHKCMSETARQGLEFQNLQIEQADEKYFVQNIKYPEDLGSIHERTWEWSAVTHPTFFLNVHRSSTQKYSSTIFQY